ncbi:MAG TPA: hypothetical protein VKA15_27990 [Isosphaeraceae bacterium]|nr:hypothetical protein [Isosphaeraceae bacterium]
MLDSPAAELRSIDEELRDVKDAIRGSERNSDVCRRFVELAWFVRPTRPAIAVRRRIDERLGSEIVEAKSHATNP